MTDLIKLNSQIPLNSQLKDDPFAYLFLSHLPPNLPLTGKTRYLKEFALALAKLEAHVENTQARNHWLCITSGFSAAISIAGCTALIPVAGVILSGGAIVAAVGTIIDAVMTKNQVESLAQTLKRHRLALNSQESQQWAALWEYAESDLFLRSLDYASDGFVVGDKLVQRGDDSPFMRAVAFIAECRGMQYVEVIEAARAVLAKPAVSNSREKPMLPDADSPQHQEPMVNNRIAPYSQPITQPAPVIRIPQTKEELIQVLRQQCPALLSLVKSHPIRCVGLQRSGKTTLVKKLALLRLVLLPEHRVIASTPHHEPTNSYPTVFQIVGIRNGKRDYPAIRKEWHSLRERVESGTVSSITTVWDEFGLMDQVMEEETLTSVLTSCLRETMKFGEYPVFIVHGETQAFLPGSKGLVTVFLNGTVRVEAIGEKVVGTDGLDTIKPTGKFKVQWLDGSWEEGKFPDWLTEELLIGMLPATAPATVPIQQVTVVETVDAPTQTEEAIAQPEQPTTVLKVSDSLGEPLKTIWLMAKERTDWVTVRDIQRKDFAILKGKGSEQIHQYLGLLADSGYGEIDEEGKSHSSVRFKAH